MEPTLTLLNFSNRCFPPVKKGPKEEIKGLRKRLGSSTFKRRDAVMAQCSSAENSHSSTGRVVCQYSLMDGMCHVKHESGLEVPHPCETLLNSWSDKVRIYCAFGCGKLHKLYFLGPIFTYSSFKILSHFIPSILTLLIGCLCILWFDCCTPYSIGNTPES